MFSSIAFLNPNSIFVNGILEQFSYPSSNKLRTIIAQAIDANAAVALFPISFLAFYRLWKKQQLSKQLMEEELHLKVNLLRTQINPNLLFESLNKLEEVLADEPKAKESIQKLSALMAYSINETGSEAVELKREIEFIEEYISLARMRLNEKKQINLEISGDTNSLKIRPLILISFVENAIKHGLNKTNKEAWVNVRIKIANSELSFHCSNSLSQEKKSTEFETSGIKLKNTRKRLAYYYPEKHKLDISETDSEYKVNLAMNLG